MPMTVVQDAMTASHACAVPVSDEQLWEMTARFVASGLDAGEHVVYFDNGNIDSVMERLDDDGVAFRGPMERGQLAVVPAEVTRSALSAGAEAVLGALDRSIDDALGRGFPAVRLTGDTAFALTQSGGLPMLEYEAGIDRMLGDRPARILCRFDRNRFPEDAIARLRALHHTELTAPAVYDDSVLRITRPGPAVLRVAGEVDHSNRPRIKRGLDTALDEALRSDSSSPEVILDLASLRFIDVAGAVSLVHAAEEFPSTHRLVLTGVRPSVMRLLDRCGAPFAAQLRVEPRATGGRS